MIDGIEVFKVEGKFDIPLVELTITVSEIHESHATLNWNQRIVAMKEIIADLIKETEKTSDQYRFNVWVSEKEDWMPT